ncbi:MAG TPA: histidine--tRNA ligase [Candidatus Methylacidiphilales bacterium]|nr:histidine--tRNA ligase [Candidatus Methylacidiphilales bacterium]
MALPGFRDFYPNDCAFRNSIFSQWRKVARRYGFIEYDGPPLEPLDLFTKKSGDEIVAQLYHFKDKGDRDVALRPEMTPTLARLVAARHRDFKKPLKWFSIPQVFRYERQQKGRLREHYQLNCDIIGEAGLEADIELIALVIDVLRAFGLTTNDFVVRLSDRQFWTDFMERRSVPEDQRYAFIQAIDKSERESREKTAEKLGPLASEVFSILEDAASTKSDRLDAVEASLRLRGLQDYIKRDFTVVRGLAYYTGVVFEAFDRSGEFRAIAGGGRYDNLLKNLGNADLPALGFGMGDVVLGEILKAKGLLVQARPPGLDMYVIITDPKFKSGALKLIQAARDQNLSAEYAFNLQKPDFRSQLETALQKRARLAVIFDAKLEHNTIGVKDLAAQIQEDVPLDPNEQIGIPFLIDYLRKKLERLSEK